MPPLGEPLEEGACEEGACEELVRVVTGAPAEGLPVDGAPAEGLPVDGAPEEGLPVDGALDVACEALVRVVTAPVPLPVAGVEPDAA